MKTLGHRQSPHPPLVQLRAFRWRPFKGGAMAALALALALALGLGALGAGAAAAAGRNVILLIGDGLDDQQIAIARNYLAGSGGRLQLDGMAVRGAARVETVSEEGAPVYVADSANTATAMATGVVTSRGRIATRAGSGEAIETIVEMMRERGARAGLVSTASVTDATVAAFAAHIERRFCENPEAMLEIDFGFITLPGCPGSMQAAGGPGSIAEQLAASGVDVLLGGGLRHFDMPVEGAVPVEGTAPVDDSMSADGSQPAGGTVPVDESMTADDSQLAEGTPAKPAQTVLALAMAHGYQAATNWSQAQAAAPASAADDGKGGNKLLGLFAPSHLPVRLQGEDGRGAEEASPSWLNRVHKYLGSVELPPVMACEANPDYPGTPSLKQMTELALARLENDNGFFLMVESASIDKQAHERKPCGSIGELAQLDEALSSALAFAARNPRTLVLLTSDHAQAAQLVPRRSMFAEYGAPVYSPGRLARIRTPEGAVLAVNYATNNFRYEEHTGGDVPVFANREGAGRVPAMLAQRELFGIMLDYLTGE